MYLMPQYAPQGLGPGDTPTFAGIKGPNGQTIVGSAGGAWTITANGTNQNIILTPSGTGNVNIPFATTKATISEIAAGYIGLSFLATATTPTTGNATLESNGTDTLLNAASGKVIFQIGGSEKARIASSGNLLLGLTTDGTGVVQLATGTTAAAGITLGDLNFFRLTNYAWVLNSADGSGRTALYTYNGGSEKSHWYTDTSQTFFGTSTALSLILRSNNTAALTLDSSQNTTFATGTQNYGGAAGAANTATCFQKLVTGIANGTATTVLTATIPNAAHSASIRVRLVGSLGAGGAIGANEATGTSAYDIAIARTAGVNAVGVISTIFGSANAPVAGAATITVTAALGAVSGAVGASNTIAIQVTITRGSGTSTNHTCIASAEIINANATGITIA